MIKFYMNVHSTLHSFGVLLDIVLSLACTQSHAHNLIFEMRSLIGHCLNYCCVTFRKHIAVHIARSILSSLPYYIHCCYQ